MTRLKIAELFTGTGAFTYGFENYDEFETVFSNDMLENSKKIYDLNYDTELTLGDINNIKNENIPKMDIITGGFPCFVAGTKVLTLDGYKNIEEVTIEDKLATHTGNFQKIINLQRKKYNGKLYNLSIKYHGEDIICTEEHPFYVRTKNNKEFSNPEWKKANELTINDYYGMIVNNNSIIPEFSFEKKINNLKTELITKKLDDKDIWFMLGYFVGDGWIEETTKNDGRPTNKIRFAINNKDEEYILERIRKILPITDKKCDTGKCKKFGCGDFYWFNIFKMFGKYAHGKKIPEWVHDAPKEYIQEFINGYMKADGYLNNDELYQITTVSYDLAYGLQRLYLKLGYIFSITKCIRPKTCIIEGRVVNQRDTYTIRGKLQKCKQSSFIEGNYVWFAPDKIEITDTIDTEVYNFEVDVDNSYIVTNTIVHNCQPFSIAGKKEGFNDERSNVFFKIISIMKHHKPRFVILENVKNLLSHDENRTFERISKEIKDAGYLFKYKILETSELTGIPQNRERIYIACFRDKKDYDKFEFPNKKVELKPIKDFLEKNVNESYYYKDHLKVYDEVSKCVQKHINTNTVYQYRRYYIRENKNNVCPTLTANMGSGGHNVPIIKDDKGIRKLTPRECFNLQGFPSNFVLPKISDSGLYHLAGNAITMPIAKLMAEKIKELL